MLKYVPILRIPLHRCVYEKKAYKLSSVGLKVCQKLKEVVFGLLIVDGKIICQIRMDRYRLHPFDALLVLNLVASTESFKSGENWTPICLPQFDSSGFLHAYVSYLSDDCQACLLLLTVHNDVFHSLSEAKQKFVRIFFFILRVDTSQFSFIRLSDYADRNIWPKFPMPKQRTSRKPAP